MYCKMSCRHTCWLGFCKHCPPLLCDGFWQSISTNQPDDQICGRIELKIFLGHQILHIVGLVITILSLHIVTSFCRSHGGIIASLSTLPDFRICRVLKSHAYLLLKKGILLWKRVPVSPLSLLNRWLLA